MYQIKKRSGELELFELSKIKSAIKRTFDSCNRNYQESIIETISIKSVADAETKIKDNVLNVEDIQDSVEKVLMTYGYEDVAKSYILYRKQHERVRNAKETVLDYKKTVDSYLKADDWRVKENASIDYSLGGLILGNSGAITANYWLSEIYDEEIANAHRNCDIHIHDLSMLSAYCNGGSLKQLIKEGLGGVPKKISSKPASHLSTLCNQIVNFLGILSLEFAGAQALSSVDTLLAPFVKVDNMSYKEVKQCIQSLVFGLNTPSRWGCVSTNTEVLSENGFKRYDELKEGDRIYTFKDGRLELNTVNKVVIKEFSGKLHSYRGRNYTQTVTPDHRVLVRKHNSNECVIKRSEEIFNVKTPYALPLSFNSSEINNNELNDDLITLAAMVYTDGSFDFRNGVIHKVTIYKSPNRFGNEELSSILNSLGLKYSFDCKDGDFGKVNKYTLYGDSARFIVDLCGNKTSIDSKFLKMSKSQAELFLHIWASFDGDEDNQLCQYDNDVIRDQLQQIAVLSGRCSYIVKDKLKSGNTTNYVKIRKVTSIYPTSREEVDYSGIVWCPSVDNGTAVFRENGCVFISGQCQPVFSNFTIDWTVPDDLSEMNCIVGGKEVDFKYKDCKREMDMINKAFLEVMIDGDADGRSFSYPILTYSITKDFDWDTESINNKLLFEMTAKYGIPYFSNYINSDMSPSDTRSMCPLHENTCVCVKNNNTILNITIKDVYNMFGEFLVDVLTPSGWCKGKPVKMPNTECFKITLENGNNVILGKNHLQPTYENGTVTADNLKIGMSLPYISENNKNTFELYDKKDSLNIEYSKIVDIEKVQYSNDLYCFEVDNDDHLFVLSNGIVTHNCRLRLDLRELRRKNGGYFGSGDGTGSIGVTTINMPRLAYLSKDEDDFYKRLDNLMDICSRSLEIKRDVVSKLLQDGLYPYTKRYVKNFNNHFSTIATHGMNEMCLNANWIKDNIASEKGYKFAKDVLDHMRNRLSDYQEKTGNLYNLESAPAESTCVVENDYIMTTKGNISVKSILNMSESERSELGIMSVNLEDKKLEVKHLKDIWKTRENAQCLKIYFDNGDSIIVTPNHKIAKRFTSGNKSSRLNWIDYVRADELKENDRLVALNKSSPLGDYVDYTVGLGTPCGKKLTFSEHNLFGEFYYGKKPEGYVFHHIDENKKNNTKSNLVMMSSTDHKRLHGKKDGYKYLPTGSGKDNNFYGKHHTEESRKKMGVRSDSENFESWYKNMCASCRSDEHRRKLSEIAKNKPSEKHSKYRHDCDTDKILELWYNGMTVSEISKTLGGKYTYSLVKSRLKISGITPNHKIVKIEKLEETFDVYDLEVEDNHNFFVSGCAEKMGVLVHNCLRFAMHDKKDFPDIITAGDKTEGAPYYTNSSNLPVGYTDDIFEALDHQDELQTRYTGGTVFHAFLGEKLPSWQAAMNLTRKIAENYKLPYFTFSPTYSICQEHGYLVGEQWKCPHCGRDTEVYSRVTGYYRAVQNFNDGKAHEFKDRKEYTNFSREFKSTPAQSEEQEVNETEDIKLERPILFTTSTCPNCKIVKQLLAEYDFVYDLVVADQDMETARKFDINQAPTLVVQDEEGNLIKIANVSNIKKFIEEAMTDIEE